MAKRRHTPEQVINKLREAEVATAEGGTAAAFAFPQPRRSARRQQRTSTDGFACGDQGSAPGRLDNNSQTGPPHSHRHAHTKETLQCSQKKPSLQP